MTRENSRFRVYDSDAVDEVFGGLAVLASEFRVFERPTGHREPMSFRGRVLN